MVPRDFHETDIAIKEQIETTNELTPEIFVDRTSNLVLKYYNLVQYADIRLISY